MDGTSGTILLIDPRPAARGGSASHTSGWLTNSPVAAGWRKLLRNTPTGEPRDTSLPRAARDGGLARRKPLCRYFRRGIGLGWLYPSRATCCLGIRSWAGRGLVFDSSPLNRARATAAPAARAAGLQLRIHEHLREIDFGQVEGKTMAEATIPM